MHSEILFNNMRKLSADSFHRLLYLIQAHCRENKKGNPTGNER